MRGIDDTRDDFHHNVPRVLPVLNGKVLDINMARVLSWNMSVDHIDGGLVVTTQHNATEVARMLSRCGGSKEFCFSGAGGSD